MTQLNPAANVSSREELLKHFKARRVHDCQTPNLIIDQAVFIENCKRMKATVDKLGWDFRAHIKTHKTAEGTHLQCQHTGTSRICVSTLPEIRMVLDAGLVERGVVTDILFTMPPTSHLIPRLLEYKERMAQYGAHLGLMVDSPAQIEFLESKSPEEQWRIYLKLDIGSRRAGLPGDSDEMHELISKAIRSPAIILFGAYTHANFSYGARSVDDAVTDLAREIVAANEAAKRIVSMASADIGERAAVFVDGRPRLAIGATPTAHAAAADTKWRDVLQNAGLDANELAGKVELHAGNYCLLDMQQSATGMVDPEDHAMTVGASVVSSYVARHEALCDAGALAMSKDTGPQTGFGPVIQPASLKGWHLGRVSQEHGILVDPDGRTDLPLPHLGSFIRIVPQHACLTAAQHAWFLITDGSDHVVDV